MKRANSCCTDIIVTLFINYQVHRRNSAGTVYILLSQKYHDTVTNTFAPREPKLIAQSIEISGQEFQFISRALFP